MQCLVVGLDGVCRNVLDPLFEKGVAPTVESIVEGGTSGPLTSQIPPWTPSAWPSLFTGVNPGKHGVFDFLAFDGYDGDVVDATHVRERTVWEYLSDEGFTSVVVNVPVTGPPRPFDGALIPGYVAPEDPTCHPEGLLDAVRDEIGSYRIYPDDERTSSAHDYAGHTDLVHMRGDAFTVLADRFEPDFGFVEFQQTDTVFHQHPGEPEAFEAVFDAVDAELERLLDRYDPNTVVVVSDHGMGRYESDDFRVNEFLRQEGYVTAKQGGEGMPTWVTVRETKLADGETGEYQPTALDRTLSAAARVGLTTQRLQRLVDAAGLTPLVSKVVPKSTVRAAEEQVDFANSVAFMRSRSELGVRINLEGREPDGEVPPAEYESVRSDLIDRLSAVRTPDGDRVFDDVAPREAYFDGPMTERAVDVVTVPSDFDHLLSVRLGSDPFGPPSHAWNHKRDGIIAVRGDGIDASGSVGDAQLLDVAPTLLALFEVPYAERMDGTVLPFVQSVGTREYETIDATPVDGDDSRGVRERLAGLGYLEDQ